MDVRTAPSLADPLTDAEIDEARRRIAGSALRTPLVPAIDPGLWLKLECLQPTGSYKIRGATNALKAAVKSGREVKRIVSASAGNFGQAIVRAASRLGLETVIHVPDSAARVKVANLERAGARVVAHSFDVWWNIMATRQTDDDGLFLHPVCEREVIAGAATIGAEIVEDLPDVDTLLIPFGGGGLSAGIAQAVRRQRPDCRIVAVEAETSQPLHAALKAGEPVRVERRPSFVDGIGSTRVLDAMWPLLSRLIDDVVIVSLAEVEHAIRRLAAEHHVIAEGAGAAAFAAAARASAGRTVAIVSGGNLDWAELRRILTEPSP